MEDPLCSGFDYLSVHQSIVDVNTTSDRLIIEQLEHEITQKGGVREEGGGEKGERRGERRGGGTTAHIKRTEQTC